MKRRQRILLGIAVVAVLGLSGRVLSAGEAQFVGADKCAAMCHKADDKGAQLAKWHESAHAKAYETLGTAKAKETAKAKGIEDPQKADACLKCHVTGHGAPAAKLAESYKKEEGVSCEGCHGAGSEYKKLSVMKDPAAAKAAGLVTPDEKTCTGCHNSESPSFKGFDFKEYSAKIAHKKPAAAAK